MSNRPLPAAIKETRGTLRPHRENEDAPPVAPMDIVQMPEYLHSCERSEEIYHQLCAHLAGMRILSQEDDFALAMLASALEEVERCTAMIEDEGRYYVTSSIKGDKLLRPHPAVGQRADAMRRAQSLLIEFGLTPASRGKVSMNKPNEENPFKML